MRRSETAMIFDIQSSSFVDGPGIRTTVFFKGCNLHCRWCHNPEGISSERQLMINKHRCIGCGKCAEVCRNNPCVFCGRCVTACPRDARKICGEELGLEAVFLKIRKDKAFYDASGGGVTCSGGECLLQTEFLIELLQLCKSEKIHTAVDTAGNIPWKRLETILPYTDLILYDIKCIDSILHKRGTGVDNDLILKNYIRLCECKQVYVRVPVIGGFNADEKNLDDIADFLQHHPPAGVELLPYHAMGEHKYVELGKTLDTFSSPSDEFIKVMQVRMNRKLDDAKKMLPSSIMSELHDKCLSTRRIN